jgi:hypothetical protein
MVNTLIMAAALVALPALSEAKQVIRTMPSEQSACCCGAIPTSEYPQSMFECDEKLVAHGQSEMHIQNACACNMQQHAAS